MHGARIVLIAKVPASCVVVVLTSTPLSMTTALASSSPVEAAPGRSPRDPCGSPRFLIAVANLTAAVVVPSDRLAIAVELVILVVGRIPVNVATARVETLVE
jgi:hypothetical protein